MDVRKREKLDTNNIYSRKINAPGELVDESDQYNDPHSSNQVGLLYWITAFIVGFCLFDVSVRLQRSCSIDTGFRSSSNGNDNLLQYFNDTQVRQHLRTICHLGRRPSGSLANEVYAPQYIIRYLEQLKANFGSGSVEMTIDEQISPLNSFPIVLFGKYHVSSVYSGLRNIAVRLHDRQSLGKHAVLINCHYDSFFGNLGASDDLVSCAVMMEMIAAMLHAGKTISLKHDLIFLFNGAEENLMQASHAFITLHRWATDVRFYVNLEAAGSDGRQMIFQTSPYHPWIMQELAPILRQPLASVIGQEIFSANIIPSDTDFRIFRDFGNVPGIDIAFITNGYVYHTYYDTEDRISQQCILHTGANLLAVALQLANSANVASVNTHGPVEPLHKLIYFDFLGLSLISYTESSAVFVNLSMVLVALLIIVIRCVLLARIRLLHVGLGVIIQLAWILANLLLALLLGYLVDRCGTKMSWYAIRYNVIGLYLLPLLWLFFSFHSTISSAIFSDSQTAHRAMCDASMIVLSLLTLLLTIWRLLSCYFVGIWLLFVLFREAITTSLTPFRNRHFTVIHIVQDTISLSIPSAYYCYMVFTLYDFFIPVLGRTGPFPSDIVIAVITGLVVVLPGIVLCSTVCLTRPSATKWMTFILLHLSISYYIFVHSTQFGFAYSQSEVLPRKQRIFVNHVTRNLRNAVGEVQLSENGLWLLSLDTNNMVPVKEQLQKVIKVPMNDVFCEMRPYCGYPMMFPFARVVDNSLWIPDEPHKQKPITSIMILSKIAHISKMVNLTLEVSGPSHTHIYIMTPCSMQIVSWSLGPEPPKPIEMPVYSNSGYRHYFIFNAYGKKPSQPLQLWFMFLPNVDSCNQYPRGLSENQVEIALAAQYLLSETKSINNILRMMPQWVVPTSLASTYEHIVVDFDQDLSYTQ